MSSQAEWQKKVLCRYYMMGVCQRGDSCPYSHDRSISNKGTIACRFFQAGTCANWDNCRFSHGEPDLEPVQQLTIQLDAGVGLEQDMVSEASSGYCDSTTGGYLDPCYMENNGVMVVVGQGGAYYPTNSSLGTLSPTYYPTSDTTTTYNDPLYCEQPYEEEAVSNGGVTAELYSTGSAPPVEPRLSPVPAHDPPVLVPLPGSASWAAPTNWAEAKEFVPKVEKPRSWAQVVTSGVTYPGCEMSISEAESLLCPFYRVGECRYGVGCAYIHGQQCDYCGQAVLHPTHLDQRRGHLAECLQDHERDMELSFAVARSKEKTCGICMETVLDKPKGEARFGILPSCTHCFCLPCIRKWRQAKQFEHKIIRACPECRQTSDYICPSRFWVETPEEKERLLTDYKKNLGQKECKYFNKGAGECPFGNKCFYQHADKDGRTVDVGPPKKPLRRANADGNLSLVQRLLLYDFLEERDGQLVLPLDFVELLDLYSDDSDEWSDSETN